MRKILIITVLLILMVSNSYSTPDNFREFADKVNLKKGEYLVLCYFNLITCIGCEPVTLNIITAINNNPELKNPKLKYIAEVDCFRDIELKIFDKKYIWKYFKECESDSRKKLNISKDAILVVFDFQGIPKLELNSKNTKGDISSQILKVINK